MDTQTWYCEGSVAKVVHPMHYNLKKVCNNMIRLYKLLLYLQTYFSINFVIVNIWMLYQA